jgi:hypothetical protein
MQSSGFKYDLSRLKSFVNQIPQKVIETEQRIGEEAVNYAIEHGNYHDVTGRLRASNRYKATESGLTLYNEAPYASDVESRGKDVLSGAALYAEDLLKRECEE